MFYEPAHVRWLFLWLKKVYLAQMFMLFNESLMKKNYKKYFQF
ncbi:hypothetical protein VCJ_000429 [Vibrio metoecus]|nr:hypothetical protein VCJ_000429 [Vibrio metoecus]